MINTVINLVVIVTGAVAVLTCLMGFYIWLCSDLIEHRAKVRRNRRWDRNDRDSDDNRS